MSERQRGERQEVLEKRPGGGLWGLALGNLLPEPCCRVWGEKAKAGER